MNNIEERLWNYMDGTCTSEESVAIAHLIATDKIYQEKYEELLAFNQELETGLEIDVPPMAFTYNVMEAIRTQEASKPLKAAIDTRIIKGIAAFFIVTIAALIAFALFNTDWSGAQTTSIEIPVQVSVPVIKSTLTGPLLKGFLFFDVVFGLFLFDAFLRRRRQQQA